MTTIQPNKSYPSLVSQELFQNHDTAHRLIEEDFYTMRSLSCATILLEWFPLPPNKNKIEVESQLEKTKNKVEEMVRFINDKDISLSNFHKNSEEVKNLSLWMQINDTNCIENKEDYTLLLMVANEERLYKQLQKLTQNKLDFSVSVSDWLSLLAELQKIYLYFYGYMRKISDLENSERRNFLPEFIRLIVNISCVLIAMNSEHLPTSGVYLRALCSQYFSIFCYLKPSIHEEEATILTEILNYYSGQIWHHYTQALLEPHCVSDNQHAIIKQIRALASNPNKSKALEELQVMFNQVEREEHIARQQNFTKQIEKRVYSWFFAIYEHSCKDLENNDNYYSSPHIP